MNEATSRFIHALEVFASSTASLALSLERLADASEALTQDGERLDRIEHSFHAIAKAYVERAGALEHLAACAPEVRDELARIANAIELYAGDTT